MPTKTRKRPVAPEDLLRFLLVSEPRISPDGTRLLFTRKHIGEKNEYVTNLWLADSEGSRPPRPFTGGGKDHHGRFSPEGQRVAFLGKRGATSQVYVIDLAGGEARELTRFPEAALGDLKWSPDGRFLAVSFREVEAGFGEEAKREREKTGASPPPRVLDQAWYRLDGDGYFGARRHHLYVIEAASGESRKVFDRDRGFGFGYDWSPDGREIAITANLEEDAFRRPWLDRLFRLEVASGKLKKVPGTPAGFKQAVTWSPDGKWIAWVGRDDDKGMFYEASFHLFVCDARSGQTRCLTARQDYCFVAETTGDTREVTLQASIRWSPDSSRIYSSLAWQGETHVASVALGGGKVTFHTKGTLEFALGGLSADGTRLALLQGSVLELGEVALGRFAGSRLEVTRRSSFNTALLEELELSKPEEHWVKSTGGAKVHCWVMKPVGWKAGLKVGAVLSVHGGPHLQYGLTFFHEFQVLAARGYAVVFANPRGSKGYGEAHAMAIAGNWGGPDWDDIQAVTAFMQAEPYVDKKRMAIVGGSYGGYMANWAIGHTHAFAAAVTDRCVSNLLSMAGSSDLPLVSDRYWKGAVWDRPEDLWEQSPIRWFKDVKTPTLVIHSEGDLRCNIEQAEQVFHALKVLGVPTRFVRYPANASHGLSRGGPPDLRLHRLGQYLEWLGKYLG